MKVLMISTDRKVFEEDSDVRRRFVLYGSLVDELHIIVFAKSSLEFKKVKLSDNVWVYPTQSHFKSQYVTNALRIGEEVGKDVTNNDILITTQDPFETGIVGAKLAQRLKVRFEVQLHTDFLSPYFKKGNFKNQFRVSLGKKVLSEADCIRVVSNRIKESIEKELLNIEVTPTVLPIFIDIEKMKNTPISTDLHKKYPQFNHITLMVSRLEKEKDIKRALNVFKDIVQNYPKAGLVIVGEGSERNTLESAVKRLNLDKNVIFEGWHKDVTSYYKTADLFLNTSLYEGYGRTLVEALATRTPVLSTDVGVATEIGADIFTTDEELLDKISKYISGEKNTLNFQLSTFNSFYPYRNEEDYLGALRNMWEECGDK